jgi:hypothetical protein
MNRDIRLDRHRDKFTLEIIQKLNEAIIRYNIIDYDEMSIDKIVEEYELDRVANEALQVGQAITDYVKGCLDTFARQELSDLWKDAEKRAEEVVLLEVDERAKYNTKSAMKDFSQESAGIASEALVKSVVYERGKEFFNINSENWESRREAASNTAETGKRAQEKWVEDLKQVEKYYKRLVQGNKMK